VDGDPATRSEPQFLYLTTTGWRSGRPHRIEIWYAELDGRYYLISELGDRAHWVQNIRRLPAISFEVGGQRFVGRGRLARPDETDLVRRVSAAFDAKYGWSDGLIVELRPLEES
jgi:deazaflavin-dependent oxidoreductase (nitroreductase family)